MGVLHLITQSGPVARLVLLSLFTISVLSWGLVLEKWRTISRVRQENHQFMTLFQSHADWTVLLGKTENLLYSTTARMFWDATDELRAVGFFGEGSLKSSATTTAYLERALLRSVKTVLMGLEGRIGWLATATSASPFIGLFGTVWGIMNAFQNIGAVGNAQLSVVAPGISEALITTASGLGVAIPAAIFYNYFIQEIRRLTGEMECFAQTLINCVVLKKP